MGERDMKERQVWRGCEPICHYYWRHTANGHKSRHMQQKRRHPLPRSPSTAPPPLRTLPRATCHADGAQKSKRLQTAKIQPELPELIVPPEASSGALTEGDERSGGRGAWSRGSRLKGCQFACVCAQSGWTRHAT